MLIDVKQGKLFYFWVFVIISMAMTCGNLYAFEYPPATGPLPEQLQLPAGTTTDLDVMYGQAEGEKLLCDLYLPKSDGAMRPAIVFIHGGGWAEGNKRQALPWCLDLVKAGFVVMSVDYRLGKPYPAAEDDCQRSIRWLRANAEKYGVDPDCLGATGQSAGGHLASLMGVTDTLHPAGDDLDKYSSKVQAVVNQFGPTQISAGDFGHGIPFDYDACCNCKADINKEASPLFHVDGTSAPFLLVQGANDPTVNAENMICMARALYKANVEVCMILLPNTKHGNGLYDPLVWPAAIRFFKRHLLPDNSQQ